MFAGMIKEKWHKIRKVDPDFGTIRNRAMFDMNGDKKLRECIKNGTFRPYQDPYHLNQLVNFCLGRFYGCRGVAETYNLHHHDFYWGTYSMTDLPEHAGEEYLALHINWDKMTQMGIRLPTSRGKDDVCENVLDMSDPINPVRVLRFYIEHCHPKNEKFVQKPATISQRTHFIKRGLTDCWYQDGSTTHRRYGVNSIRELNKKMALCCGFDNWEKCTNHGNRAYGSTMLEQARVPEHERARWARQKSSKSQVPYVRQTNTSLNRQLAGIHGSTSYKPDVLSPPLPKTPVKKTVVFKKILTVILRIKLLLLIILDVL